MKNSCHMNTVVTINIKESKPRDKERYEILRVFIMIKESVHPEDIIILNVYMPTNIAPKYIK